MGLNKDTIKYLEKQAKKKASELAHEAQQRLTNGYVSFIDLYYSDYTPQQYVRTHNLYRSYNKFYKNSHGTIFYGGVEVTPERMFDNYDQITPSDLMSEFIYNPKGTYHGCSAVTSLTFFNVFLYSTRFLIAVSSPVKFLVYCSLGVKSEE